MQRPDILVAITRLASRISKWSAECDRRLERLYDYLKGHSDSKISGTLSSSDFEDCYIVAWPDADLAGDAMSSKSTMGRFIELVGKSGNSMPLAWSCKKIDATCHSTPEAETASLDSCVREDCINLQSLLCVLLGKKVPVHIMEDNETTIGNIQKGYSPALKYMLRTQRVDIGLMHEIFEEGLLDDHGDYTVAYCESSKQKGDLFTKELDTIEKFKEALRLIGMSVS